MVTKKWNKENRFHGFPILDMMDRKSEDQTSSRTTKRARPWCGRKDFIRISIFSLVKTSASEKSFCLHQKIIYFLNFAQCQAGIWKILRPNFQGWSYFMKYVVLRIEKIELQNETQLVVSLLAIHTSWS